MCIYDKSPGDTALLGWGPHFGTTHGPDRWLPAPPFPCECQFSGPSLLSCHSFLPPLGQGSEASQGRKQASCLINFNKGVDSAAVTFAYLCCVPFALREVLPFVI